jgi:hypothetical protein
MLKQSLLAAAAIGLAVVTPSLVSSPAEAAVGVRAGVLTCNVAGGAGFILGSDHAVSCTFSGNGRVEHYSGNISKFGVDLGYTKGGVLMWAVLAPTNNPPPHALTGEYGGVTAGASVGVGGNANLLVGGSNHEISLQPLSVEGERGLNVAAGIAEITLRPMG